MKPPRTPADDLVSSRVWITVDGVAFPDAGWWDLPLSVIGSALAAYAELRDGGFQEDLPEDIAQASSYFFDGPFALAYRRTADAEPVIYLEGNRENHEGELESLVAGEMPLESFRVALLGAAQILHAEVVTRGHLDEQVRIAAGIVTGLT
ncbi:hypothetical protein ADL15_23725 [Actinoplanes awajinensis subsp. mycoplanecinus]|uniref:Uncharacterized protein n=1 Tax=Actinoplanes awajinensis subsp. mycoplanecinus TaxID=135947 RepID=A0A101JQ43_9ACTN|nr:hypothetical protein ADL15_23725 [Actinoplanes awajinensis subsp. mycoplanecinus]